MLFCKSEKKYITIDKKKYTKKLELMIRIGLIYIFCIAITEHHVKLVIYLI